METTSKEMNSLLLLQKNLQSQREAQAKRLEILDEELKAVNTTLRLLRNGSSPLYEQSIKVPIPPFVSPPIDIKFEGMTQLKALTAIALNGNGRVKIVEARKILEKAGLLKHTKNGYNILYNVITKSGKFERSGPGEYRLLPDFEQMINRVVAGEETSKVVDEMLGE